MEADRAAGMATTRGGAGGDELVLPMNAYGYTVPERDELGRARQVLTDTCMRRLGYDTDPAAETVRFDQSAAIDLADHGVYGNKRRYVLTDPAVAARYGYHLVSTATQVASGPRDPRRASAPTMPEREALSGVDADGRPVTHNNNGQPIPAGGCVGAADHTLTGTGRAGEADPVSKLDADSYQHSLRDPRVLAAFDAWSHCMTGRGYHLPGPLHASDAFGLDTHTVTPAEIATAQADVACKRQTRLTDIWFESEVAYQKTQIRQHANQFHQAKLDHDSVMATVARILANHH
ncbi:hypothetical protein [Rugosimonospora africana]|uniref:Uncharacterized protein n=1 Tax=Rugosimonospora africana TaxID=556532 RepID=A0A8J3QTL4_9ACTN|nr:hypothetical protein [Rugosimonospora africana]GIH17235.1 hypothetical protein Raf01_54070 [Rugosimonospora africana]